MKILKRIIILKWIFLQYESVSEYLNNSLIFNMENTVNTVMVFFGFNTIFLTLYNPYTFKIRCICKIMYDYDPFLQVSRLNPLGFSVHPLYIKEPIYS